MAGTVNSLEIDVQKEIAANPLCASSNRSHTRNVFLKETGAGDGIRTRNPQLGKLTPLVAKCKLEPHKEMIAYVKVGSSIGLSGNYLFREDIVNRNSSVFPR